MRRFKCLVLGMASVGKTCMVMKYVTDTFPEEYIPTVFDENEVRVTASSSSSPTGEEEEVCLSVWDSARRGDYDRLFQLNFLETDVYILCVSVVDRSSIAAARDTYFELLREHCFGTHGATPNAKLLLVGTKSDLRVDPTAMEKISEETEETPVTREELEEFGYEIGAMAVVENSALSGSRLHETFETAARLAMDSSLRHFLTTRHRRRRVIFDPMQVTCCGAKNRWCGRFCQVISSIFGVGPNLLVVEERRTRTEEDSDAGGARESV